jgi:hypothetical protein
MSVVETVLGLIISVLLLLVITWIGIFGGIGALLSRKRGGSAPAGLAWGTVLGPVGWLVIIWTTREGESALIAEQQAPSSYQPLSTTSSAAPERWDPWNE